MNNMSKSEFEYGESTDLFVTRKSNGGSIVLGGTGEDTSKWIRILSNRAAQLLWFQVTQELHPDKAKKATTVVTTAPMREANSPTITTHTNFEKAQNFYSIVGWIGNKTWQADLTEQEAERFWIALSRALYPSKKQ